MKAYEARYFTDDEYECACGCGLVSMHPKLLRYLDIIRNVINRPVWIASGCRCKKQNDAVAGAIQSAHMPDHMGRCNAVDLVATDSNTRMAIVAAAIALGIKRIGIGKGVIHLDIAITGTYHQNIIWLY